MHTAIYTNSIYILRQIKHHIVLLIVGIATLISAVFVPPSLSYVDYFERRTLISFICLLIVIAALENVGFLKMISSKLIGLFKSIRAAFVSLVTFTFFLSMFITNDFALLVVLPITYLFLKETDNINLLALLFILEALAANLGSMFMPFGNPQNIFIYSFYNLNVGEFLNIMIFPTAISLILLVIAVLFIKNNPVTNIYIDYEYHKPFSILYLATFILTLGIVFRFLPVWSGALIIASVLLSQKQLLLKVDWDLMVTFILFFILTGNLANIDAINYFLTELLDKSVFYTSVLGGQIISNVPTSFILVKLTDSYKELLLGVNIGGVGALIASLANLIVISKYKEYSPNSIFRFLLLFTCINFIFLLILVLTTHIIVL